MAKQTWEIQMNQGYFMSWCVTTQAGNKVTVTLQDELVTYFSASKQSYLIDPPLSSGNAFVKGSKLSVTVDVPASSALLGSPYSSDILTSEGVIVGKVFNICIEDQTDKDYNDVAVSIIGWKSKG
jgi:hypothetical protein